MRIATTSTLLLSLVIASGCGGKIVTESSGAEGGGGAGGGSSSATNTNETGLNPKDCPTVTCTQDATSCSCETTCLGPHLRANCSIHADGMIICECHYADGYMGTCAPSSGPLCGLPDGCCEAYVP